MKVYIYEPRAKLYSQLALNCEFEPVGHADSVNPPAIGTPEHEITLVSAEFSASDIFRFLADHRQNIPQIVIVEIEEEPAVVLPYLEAGAAGYVRRGASMSEFARTLHEIRLGKPPLAPPIGDALLDRMHELLALKRRSGLEYLQSDYGTLESLTRRELQVLHLMRNGASNQEIANELLIELGTVKNHVHSILKKLNVRRRSQAAQYLNLLEQVG